MKPEVIVILDNIRSAHNVGSIFRTADGAGVGKIYLVGTTPTPIDRFGREVPEIMKTSLGASSMVSWGHVENDGIMDLIRGLKGDGYEVVAIEQTPKSIPLHEFIPASKVAYIFGHEVDGVNSALVDAADRVVEIPMRGEKESLNVSVTAGIILFKQG